MTDSAGGAPSRDMLHDQQIADAQLENWRELGQELHTRFLYSSFTEAVRF
jgi:hypothetical protein